MNYVNPRSPNPPVTPSGGYDHETRGFKMKAAYDKTHMLQLEPSDDLPTESADWRNGYQDGFRSGFTMAIFALAIACIIGFVLYVGCK